MNKDTRTSLGWGIGIVGLALLATLARRYDIIGEDMPTRLVLGVTGLMVVWLGNRLPKTIAPSRHRRQVQRMAGWSMVLSGLVYAAVFAFAPLHIAVFVGCGAIILGLAVTVGYTVSLRRGVNAA